jgi:hypothetical protein
VDTGGGSDLTERIHSNTSLSIPVLNAILFNLRLKKGESVFLEGFRSSVRDEGMSNAKVQIPHEVQSSDDEIYKEI